jgi:hypothetical protein
VQYLAMTRYNGCVLSGHDKVQWLCNISGHD